VVRRATISLAAALVVAALVCVEAPSAAHTARASTLEAQALSDINAVRAQHGLRPLRISLRLNAAARQHSTQMAASGYFSHSSADGTAFWRRIGRFYGSGGYRYWSVGENLLWASPSVDAGGMVKMWMGSPEHRANLLGRRWREIGLSAVHVASAPGVYGGREVTIITNDFGVRAR
jgi:uncharacterized protein YkwD